MDEAADLLRRRDHRLRTRGIAREPCRCADQAGDRFAVRKLAGVTPAIEVACLAGAGAAETLMREEIGAFLNRLLERRLRRRDIGRARGNRDGEHCDHEGNVQSRAFPSRHDSSPCYDLLGGVHSPARAREGWFRG